MRLGRVVSLTERGDDGVADDRGSVDNCELVVPGREPTPLLESAGAPLGDVPVLMVDRIASDEWAASGSTSFTVPLLVTGFREQSCAQMLSDRSGGVRLVATYPTGRL